MNWILKGIGFALLFALFVLGAGWVTMLLWNWLMPEIFGLTLITFWQALGLLVLGKLLFGGFFRGGRGGCGHHRGWHGKHGYWKKRWESKMANMTPEEKEKFRAGMQKCGWWDNRCEDVASPSEESGGRQ